MSVTGEKILIFGGTGSLGQALIRRLSNNNEIVLFSRDEAKHWTIKNQNSKNQNLNYVVGDIRDRGRVEETILYHKPTIIIIASALKQVDTCEVSPFESVQTNILGIQNIVDSVKYQIEKLPQLGSVLMVSTDKACAPTNVYGMCKAVAERLVTSASQLIEGTRLIGVRYGNVLESRGSIIPLFRYQSEHQEFLTITHPDMTRFIMTLDESIDLIESTIKGGASGELWLPKLKSMKIMHLAEIFSERYGKPIKTIGIRPGEKLHEDLISRPESIRIRDEDGFYKMSSSHSKVLNSSKIFDYSSDGDVLTKSDLEKYLEDLGIFDQSLDQFKGREIEEIKTS